MAKGGLFSRIAGRKGEGDNDVFMYAFIVVLLVAAGTYASNSGVGGVLFSSLSNALAKLGLMTESACPFYKEVSTAAWACIVVFGILPFIIVYYFTFDALSFTFMTTKTKGMLSLGVSMIATVPMDGRSLISSLSATLKQFTEILLPPLGEGSNYLPWGGFLAIMLIMALISGFLGQLALTSQMANAAVLSLQETIWGYRAMNQIGKSVVATGKKEG